MLRTYLKISSLLLFVVFWRSINCNAADSVDFQLNTIKSLAEEERFDSAAGYAEDAIDYIQLNQLDQPKDLIYLSWILLKVNRQKKALSTLLNVSENKTLTSDEKADVHAQLASLFTEVKSYQLAIDNFKKTIRYYNKSNMTLFYWYGNIGRNYLDMYQEDSARVYFRKQLTWAIQNDSAHEVALARNNIGFGFIRENMPDSAVYYYQMATENLLQPGMSSYDLILYSNLQVNIGNVFYDKGQKKVSQIYFEEAYKVARTHGMNDLILESGLALFRTYIDLNKYKQAEQILSELNLLKDLTNDDTYNLTKGHLQLCLADPSKPLHKEKLDAFIRQTELQRSNYEEGAENNVDLTSNYLIKLATVENALNKSLVDQTESRLKIAEQRKQNLKLLIFILILGLLIPAVVVFLYINGKRKQARLRSELLEKDKENLEYELRLKEHDLTNFAITLNIKKEQNLEVLELLNIVKKKELQEIKSGLDDVIKELKSKMNTEKTLDKFEQNFEMVNAKFFDQLTERFPNLTRYEREFCAMIRLNLNNKEIASLKGISLNSAKVSKYRLKKKLDLSEQEDIALFLQRI